MSDTEIQLKILEKVDGLEPRIGAIEVTMARNTESLEHHVKRTDELQDLITPVYEEFISRKAVEEYKKKQRDLLIYKLKLPAYIAAALTAIGTMLAWLLRK